MISYKILWYHSPYHIYDITSDINYDRKYDIIDRAYDIIVHDNAYDISNDMQYDID